jgi:hypothetical protein
VKRIGPELKMPKLKGGEIKVPPFLLDLYVDLRERRLLPLVALLIVGIIAAPILLKEDPSEPEAAPVPSAIGGASEGAAASSLTVVKAEPGLRNYKKRLVRRSPTDPFKQRFTGPVLKGSELNEKTTTSTSTTTESTSTDSETVVTSPSGGSGDSSPGGSSPGGSGTAGTLTYYSFAIDVQISRAWTKPDGTVEKTEPEKRDRVLPPAPLPGEKAPVVTYMGLGGKRHNPLFLISNDVTGVFGEGDCVSGTGVCQLIELEVGMPEVFVYGENDVRYKVLVTKVEPVVTGHT